MIFHLTNYHKFVVILSNNSLHRKKKPLALIAKGKGDKHHYSQAISILLPSHFILELSWFSHDLYKDIINFYYYITPSL